MEALFLLLFFAPVMGYLAICKGHNFWLWFWIGLFLPVISLFILFFLKDKKIIHNPDDYVYYENKDKVLFKK